MEVVYTTLHPDIILWSTEDQKMILVELTVQWEGGYEETHERKALKYQSLVQECKDKGWYAWLFAIQAAEVSQPNQQMVVVSSGPG